MKFIVLPLTIAIIICSCKSKTTDKDKEAPGTITTTDRKIDRLNPSAVDVNKPIDAIEANFQIDCWNGKKIEVVGYGFVFYGDSLDTKSGLMLTDSAGGSKRLIDCRFVNPPSLPKIAKTDMIHIRGKINGCFSREIFDGAIIMDSCEIVSVAKSITTQPVDPFGKTVMNVNELLADYYKWDGKEISVTGDYDMTTISTTSYGKTIRVDLKNSATNDKVAGCDFKEDPSEKITGNEKGVIIKGKIKAYTPYGYLMLEDCSLVNR